MAIADEIKAKRANQFGLFVGINKHPDSPLYGCVNDAITMYNIATKVLGFKKENCMLLLDENANKENVVKALKGLMERSDCTDTLWTHFSTHGSQVPDRSGDEPDHVDECIILYTPRGQNWWETCILRDDDFQYLVRKMCKPGTRYIATFDCCHTGSGLRLIGDNSVDNSALKVARYMPPPMSVIEELVEIAQQAPEPELNEDPDLPAEVLACTSIMCKIHGMLEKNLTFSTVSGRPYRPVANTKDSKTVEMLGDAVLYSGCLSTEVSYDITRNGIPMGAMSYGMSTAIKNLSGQSFTYQQLFNEMIKVMAATGYYPRQHPQLEIDPRIKDTTFMT